VQKGGGTPVQNSAVRNGTATCERKLYRSGTVVEQIQTELAAVLRGERLPDKGISGC